MTVKKLSMATAGALLSGLCLDVEGARTQEDSSSSPDGVFLSSPPTPNRINVISGENSNGQYELQEGFPEPQEGPIPHVQPSVDEAFYLLEGSAEFQLGDQTSVKEAGDFVFVPRGTTHAFQNLGTKQDSLKLLLINNPPELIQTLGQLGTQGTDEYYENLVTEGPPTIEVPDSLSFDEPAYNINENGMAEATVRRVGRSEEPASATIVVSDDTNTLDNIPINFTSQEATQTVEVPISIDDYPGEGAESIDLTLTEATGSTVAPVQDQAVVSSSGNIASVGDDSSNSLNSGQELQSFGLKDAEATIVATGKDTDRAYSLLDVTVSPNTGVQSYINNQADQGLYVLDGNVSLQLNNKTQTLGSGSFAFVPEGQPYKFGNLGTTSARLALIRTPPVTVPEPPTAGGAIGGLLMLVGFNFYKKNKRKKRGKTPVSEQR